MLCPIDNETLVMADRSGVEIDYCPKCRGVWLDRGELDKVIERAAAAPVAAPREASAPVYQPEPGRAAPPQYRDERKYGDERRHGDDRKHGDHDRYDGDSKRRKGFLGELFDF